jgi:hypothetical protein
MSVASRLSLNRGRPLRPEEEAVVAALIADKPFADEVRASLSQCRVEEMNDGGMGSLIFLGNDQSDRRLSGAIAEADFVDADGVRAEVVLNVDQYGQLFELDIWKVDFSPLQRLPNPAGLRVRESSPDSVRTGS